ncbi:MAG: prolyl oligopeptidase family serine peptidase [Bacillota bacterium]|nr:prolyl oligopeptidase family serine peptidase [Bacillota bacterium]
MEDPKKEIEELKRAQAGLSHALAGLHKAIDNVLWYERMRDVAHVDMVTYVAPPPANPLAQGAQDKGNPLKIRAYTFVPIDADPGLKYPLLVYPHGGVHANFSSGGATIVKEMVAQGYIVIAPDYRGSTGYGEQFHNQIDYGGLEVEDVLAGRDWMVENEPLVDPERVGIMGWSHGGLITLFNIFRYPEKYKVAYAGVPVSDLVARMGYKHPHYHGLFAAPYHIGRWAYDDPAEYRRRSPAWHADKLQTPLLVHTTTNDEDVNCLEVEHLIKSLTAAGKDFEYKIYDRAPGGHVFNRIDTQLAKESRREIWQFLARYLNPPRPL